MFFEFAKEDDCCKREEKGGKSGEESIEDVRDKHQTHVDGRDDDRYASREEANRKEGVERKADDGPEDLPRMTKSDFFTALERLTIRWSFTDDDNGIKNRADSINDSRNDEEESPEDRKACSKNSCEEERENVSPSLLGDRTE